eukprot:1659479-Pyramimonas_sp.AAC.1
MQSARDQAIRLVGIAGVHYQPVCQQGSTLTPLSLSLYAMPQSYLEYIRIGRSEYSPGADRPRTKYTLAVVCKVRIFAAPHARRLS